MSESECQKNSASRGSGRDQEASGDPAVVAVAVTYNRLELLMRLLDRLLETPEVSEILVVDNCSSDGTGAWLDGIRSSHPSVSVLHMDRNVGGAGGFAAGLRAVHGASDAGFYWLMDDDGVPEQGCLGELLSRRDEFDFWGPAVLSEQDPRRLCFPVRTPGSPRVLRTLAELEEASVDGCVRDIVIPFNGVLLTRELVNRIGVVRSDYFIWGDDVEYLWRARSRGARVGTVVGARFQHPSTDSLGTPMFFGMTTYNDSASDLKLFCMVRNNTVNLLEYRSVAHAAVFWFKTFWFYSFVRPSSPRRGLAWKAIRDALRRDFHGHLSYLRSPTSDRVDSVVLVAAVVVTFKRPHLLEELLDSLEHQTRRVDAVFVIDNGNDAETQGVLATPRELDLRVVHTRDNLGGAGGFNRGMRLAYEGGFDRIWLMDDDVKPSPTALEFLLADGGDCLACAREDLDGNLVEKAAVRFDLSNPLRIRPKVSTVENVYKTRSSMPARVRVENAAFEGFMVTRRVIEDIGFPDPSFFIFYDDCDYELRARLGGYEVFVVRDALMRRQLGFGQTRDLGSWKGFYMIRNFFVVHFRYGKNILVRAKPYFLTVGGILVSPLRGGAEQRTNLRKALREARGMRTLDNAALPPSPLSLGDQRPA